MKLATGFPAGYPGIRYPAFQIIRCRHLSARGVLMCVFLILQMNQGLDTLISQLKNTTSDKENSLSNFSSISRFLSGYRNNQAEGMLQMLKKLNLQVIFIQLLKRRHFQFAFPESLSSFFSVMDQGKSLQYINLTFYQ